MTIFAQELGQDRWAQDLSDARNARLRSAIRRQRKAERASRRASRLLGTARLAAQRSEAMARNGALTVAR